MTSSRPFLVTTSTNFIVNGSQDDPNTFWSMEFLRELPIIGVISRLYKSFEAKEASRFLISEYTRSTLLVSIARSNKACEYRSATRLVAIFTYFLGQMYIVHQFVNQSHLFLVTGQILLQYCFRNLQSQACDLIFHIEHGGLFLIFYFDISLSQDFSCFLTSFIFGFLYDFIRLLFGLLHQLCTLCPCFIEHSTVFLLDSAQFFLGFTRIQQGILNIIFPGDQRIGYGSKCKFPNQKPED